MEPLEKIEKLTETRGLEKRPEEVIVVPRETAGREKQLQAFGIKAEVPVENFRREAETPGDVYRLKFKLGETGVVPRKAWKQVEGLTVAEGIAVAAQRPEILEERSIDLVGSRYRRDCTPTVYRWNSEIKLSAICSDVSDPMCGPAFAEKREGLERSN